MPAGLASVGRAACAIPAAGRRPRGRSAGRGYSWPPPSDSVAVFLMTPPSGRLRRLRGSSSGIRRHPEPRQYTGCGRACNVHLGARWPIKTAVAQGRPRPRPRPAAPWAGAGPYLWQRMHSSVERGARAPSHAASRTPCPHPRIGAWTAECGAGRQAQAHVRMRNARRSRYASSACGRANSARRAPRACCGVLAGRAGLPAGSLAGEG